MQLTIILIVFSLLISFVIASVDFSELNEQVRESHNLKIELAEKVIINSLHTIDKVYNLVDVNTASQMEVNTNELLEKYEENPDFSTWNISELEKKFDMEIFIINENNVIEYTSYENDIGLDFVECCKRLAELLDTRRENGGFFHDGMDVQQKDGQIKKFSYQATLDKKYIIELGMSLQDDPIFQEFNFLDEIAKLENTYEEIKSINVYTRYGILLGYTNSQGSSKEIANHLFPYLKKSYDVNEPQQFTEKTSDRDITYRYIPYSAEDDQGLATQRVVEIVYDNGKLDNLLSYYKERFFIQIFIIVVGAILLSFVIARLVAKPIYLAFHDSLTGLKNRAAFEDNIMKRLKKNEENLILMMIDLDNFKVINDTLGHAEGDRILKSVAKIIQNEVGMKNISSRIGGDEFVVIFSETEMNRVRKMAQRMLDNIATELLILPNGASQEMEVSMSIGIAKAKEGDKIDKLYDRADRALYKSKENGKNQFTIYEEMS